VTVNGISGNLFSSFKMWFIIEQIDGLSVNYTIINYYKGYAAL